MHRERRAHNPKRRGRGPAFTFTKLSELLHRDSEDVVASLYLDLNQWKELLQKEDLVIEKPMRNGRIEITDDLLYVIVCMLGDKVCSSTRQLSIVQDEVLRSTAACNNLYAKISEKCRRYKSIGRLSDGGRPVYKTVSKGFIQSPLRFLRCCLKICQCWMEMMEPDALDHLSDTFSEVSEALIAIRESGEFDNVSPLLEETEVLRARFGRRFEVVSSTLQEGTEGEGNVGDAACESFRNIPVVPKFEEVRVSINPRLRPNQIHGAYESAEDYLDVQFRLLREDFVRPLRQGMLDFYENKKDYLSGRRDPPPGNIRLYRQVQIYSMDTNRGKLVNYVQLRPQDFEDTNWEEARRLLPGSLLLLSDDEFETAYFAVVHNMMDNAGTIHEQGIVCFSWEGCSPEFNTRSKFLMIENNVYFEAYRHTLQVLQEIKWEDFPISKYIVEASTEVCPPTYLVENTHSWKIKNFTFSALAPDTWPTRTELSLGKNQYEAFQACLTREFVIVQGPPGTGKTYLALKVVETLLVNERVWKPELGGAPILVVCYTNHALDQFLEGILKIFRELRTAPSLVRIGGRSSSQALAEFSLSAVREQNPNRDEYLERAKREAYGKLRHAEANCLRCIKELEELEALEDVVILDSLLVWNEINKELPPVIIEFLTNPAWIDIESFVSGPEDESPVEVFVTELTKMELETLESPKVEVTLEAMKNMEIAPEVKQKVEIAPEVTEDYDGEELERLESEMPKILTDRETKLFEKLRKECEHELNYWKDKSTIMKGREYAGDKITNLKNNLNMILKRRKFSKSILKAYRANSFPLVDVTKHLQKGATVEPPLTPVSLSADEKWSIYFRVILIAKEKTVLELRKAEAIISQTQKRLMKVLRTEDARVLAEAKIVGMTTTGAAKYNDLLKILKPKIVIVEEAAKVLEAHIVASLTPACEHLILIGDHQQLRPSTAVYELATEYNLDVSLFERMVKNNMNCYTLDVQHRMRPEISELLVGSIYPSLQNAPSVELYPRVFGLTSNLFFIDHTNADSAERGCTSKMNLYEARYMAALCRHLLHNGYEPDQVTILATYTGQVSLIRKHLDKLKVSEAVRVTSVDNFQGEENCVILLSLVRSNERGDIGFLKADNRICVAISRARHGLYVTGNISQLAGRSKTWQQIQEKLRKDNRVGNTVEIKCEVHGKVSTVRKPEDFMSLAPKGGCTDMCRAKLPCGHVCASVCHGADRTHTAYECQVQVIKTLQCGHKVPRRCYEISVLEVCRELVEKALPCGHTAGLPCCFNPRAFSYKRSEGDYSRDERRKKNERFSTITDEIICGSGVFYFRTTYKSIGGSEDSDDGGSEYDIPKYETNIKRQEADSWGDSEFGSKEDVEGDPLSSTEDIKFGWKEFCEKLCRNGLHPCRSKHRCHDDCPPCIEVSGTCSFICGHEELVQCGVERESKSMQLCSNCAREKELAVEKTSAVDESCDISETSPAKVLPSERSFDDVKKLVNEIYFFTPVDEDLIDLKRKLLNLLVSEIKSEDGLLFKYKEVDAQALGSAAVIASQLRNTQRLREERSRERSTLSPCQDSSYDGPLEHQLPVTQSDVQKTCEDLTQVDLKWKASCRPKEATASCRNGDVSVDQSVKCQDHRKEKPLSCRSGENGGGEGSQFQFARSPLV